MSKKGETGLEHKQPYDTTFKSLLDDVTLALLSFLFGERIIFAQELKESLFKQDTIEPGLRVDCAYHLLSREREEADVVVGTSSSRQLLLPTLSLDCSSCRLTVPQISHNYRAGSGLPVRDICPP